MNVYFIYVFITYVVLLFSSSSLTIQTREKGRKFINTKFLFAFETCSFFVNQMTKTMLLVHYQALVSYRGRIYCSGQTGFE